ncbi:MAG: hypothetical protein WAX07_06050 [Candidatus Altiarchaeia archaeon]
MGFSAGFSRLRDIAVSARPHEPMDTNMNVPNPMGLWDFCLSILNARDRRM